MTSTLTTRSSAPSTSVSAQSARRDTPRTSAPPAVALTTSSTASSSFGPSPLSSTSAGASMPLGPTGTWPFPLGFQFPPVIQPQAQDPAALRDMFREVCQEFVNPVKQQVQALRELILDRPPAPAVRPEEELSSHPSDDDDGDTADAADVHAVDEDIPPLQTSIEEEVPPPERATQYPTIWQALQKAHLAQHGKTFNSQTSDAQQFKASGVRAFIQAILPAARAWPQHSQPFTISADDRGQDGATDIVTSGHCPPNRFLAQTFSRATMELQGRSQQDSKSIYQL